MFSGWSVVCSTAVMQTAAMHIAHFMHRHPDPTMILPEFSWCSSGLTFRQSERKRWPPSLSTAASPDRRMHQNRTSPSAGDFFRRRGYREEFRNEAHFYLFSSRRRKTRFASDFLRRGNRASWGLQNSCDFAGRGRNRRRNRRESRDFGALRSRGADSGPLGQKSRSNPFPSFSASNFLGYLRALSVFSPGFCGFGKGRK